MPEHFKRTKFLLTQWLIEPTWPQGCNCWYSSWSLWSFQPQTSQNHKSSELETGLVRLSGALEKSRPFGGAISMLDVSVSTPCFWRSLSRAERPSPLAKRPKSSWSPEIWTCEPWLGEWREEWGLRERVFGGDLPNGNISHDGSMVLVYMVTWIPSIYPLYVSIYTSTMDPMGNGNISWWLDLWQYHMAIYQYISHDLWQYVYLMLAFT